MLLYLNQEDVFYRKKNYMTSLPSVYEASFACLPIDKSNKLKIMKYLCWPSFVS